MSIVFMDGFDHYTTGDIAKKWDEKWINHGDIYIQNVIKRNGAQALKLSGGAFSGGHGGIIKYIPTTNTAVVGFWINKTSGYTKFLYFMDGGTIQIRLTNNSDGSLSVHRKDTLLATSVAGLITLGIPLHIQMKVVFSKTVGSIEVRVNELTVINLINVNTCDSPNEYCTNIRLLAYDRSVNVYIDDFWIDDTDFNGDLAIETLYPNGAGSNTSWIPSAGLGHECVDEALFNEDTDYISSVTVDAVETYAYADPSLIGAIKAIQQTIIARRDEDGTNKIAPVVKVGETIQVGSTVPLVLPYTFNSVIYNTNPADSQAWEIVDLNGAEFGVKIIE
jgi:hypothetical protein